MKLAKIIFMLFLFMACINTQQIWAVDPTGPINTTSEAPNSGTVGDPISSSVGEYRFSIPLLNLNGPLPISFFLHYANWVDKSVVSYNDPFGSDGFSNNYHIGLKSNSSETSVKIFFHKGNILNFFKSSGTWQINEEEVIYQLNESTDYYYLMSPLDELVYTFKKETLSNGDKVGVLVRIEDRKGNALTITNILDSGNYWFPVRIEDGLGRYLNFTWIDPSSTWKYPHLSVVTDQNSRTLQFTYNIDTAASTIHLASVTDPMGNITSFTYSGPADNNVVSAITYPKGNTPYTQTYSYVNIYGYYSWRADSQTDAYNNKTEFAYDNPTTWITTITEPNSNTYSHTNQNYKLLTGVTDQAGNTATITYDTENRRSTITDRLGDTTTITYHGSSGKIASYTDAAGHTTTYTYTAENQTFTNSSNGDNITFTFYNLTRIDYADGTYEEFNYDLAHNGNIISHVNRAGKILTFTYNARGQILTATNPAGGAITYTYNADATLASKIDPETGTTTYGYDAYKRLNRITHPDDSYVQITYNANDQITSVSDERGKTYNYAYDANGNLVSLTDPQGNAVQYVYDLMDRIISITNRLGQTATTTYDIMGRKGVVTDPNGIIKTYGYDPRGWHNQTNIGGQTWQIGYDKEGVVSSTTTPLGFTTTYQTNKLGKITKITDPLGNNINIDRDTHQRITGITNPLGHTTAFSYNGWDTLNSVTMPVIGTITYHQNDMGLLTKITDLNSHNWDFNYSNMGKAINSTDPLGNRWEYAYNNRGFISQITFPEGGNVSITYDKAGNITQKNYSGGPTLNYTYDDLNRLIVADNIGFTYDKEGNIISTDNQGIAFGATYNNGGQVKTVSYVGGTFTVTYTYDATNGLLTDVEDSLTGTAITFSYDNDMRLIKINRPNSVNTSFTLDSASRLTRIQHGTIGDIEYIRDEVGHITQAQMTLPLDPATLLSSETNNFTYDDASQLSSTGYSYNKRGQRTADSSRNYTWDNGDRLITAGGASFAYNGLGNIISRTKDTSSVNYYYNYAIGFHPIMAERDDSSGSWLRYYIYTPEGKLLYMIDAQDSNKVYFYHFDNIGSTLFLTDIGGTVTDSYAYTPYGKLLGHNGINSQPFTFIGEFGVRQEGTGGNLYQMQARYYDASTGAFVSRDPLWPAIASAKSINPYQYALRNPMSIIDPTGRQTLITDFIQKLANSGNTSTTSYRKSTWINKDIVENTFETFVPGYFNIKHGNYMLATAEIAISATYLINAISGGPNSSDNNISTAEDILNHVVPGYENFNKGQYGKAAAEVALSFFKHVDKIEKLVKVERAICKEPAGIDTSGKEWDEKLQEYRNIYGPSVGGRVTALMMTIASYPANFLDKVFGAVGNAISGGKQSIISGTQSMFDWFTTPITTHEYHNEVHNIPPGTMIMF